MPLPRFAAALPWMFGLGLAAQDRAPEPERRPTFVRVESASGDTVAGAVVTFAGCLPHLGVEVGPRDVQQVATDARGRAQAKLSTEACYAVWAVGPANERGERAATPAHGWIGAGRVLTLRLGDPTAPRRVRWSGAEAWAAVGPLRCFAMTSAPGTEVELAPDVDGMMTLPHDPVVVLEVRTARGEPLWTLPVGDTVAIPPPARVPVRVTDDSGAALPGAIVRHRVGRLSPWRFDGLGSVGLDRWRELGRADADGKCEVTVPYLGNPLQDPNGGDLLLFAGAAGRSAVAGGIFRKAPLQDDRKLAKFGGDVLEFRVPSVSPLAGTVGPAHAGATVHLAAVCKMWFERSSYQHDPRSFTTTVGGDGSFVFADVPEELHSCRLSLVRADGSVQGLPIVPAMQGRIIPPEFAEGGTGVDGFADVVVACADPAGAKTAGVVMVLVPAERPGVLLRDASMRVVTGARGSRTLRLALGKWMLFASNDSGWAAQVVDVGAATSTIDLGMQPMQSMRVLLRDPGGSPVAGASVNVGGSTVRGSNDPLQSLLQSLRSHWANAWAQLRTDANGQLVIAFVPVEGVLQKLRLTAPSGATTEEFVLEPNADGLVLTLK
ncbi:MAG: hypothetical protein JNK15_13620 [Planctomycetes bacterium]|nr:hypothetical protein [Planctomycetota bacterium]